MSGISGKVLHLRTLNEEEMRIELSDSIHDIAKYTVVVNSAL